MSQTQHCSLLKWARIQSNLEGLISIGSIHSENLYSAFINNQSEELCSSPTQQQCISHWVTSIVLTPLMSPSTPSQNNAYKLSSQYQSISPKMVMMAITVTQYHHQRIHHHPR